jgi:hypothetical protein
MKEDNDVEQLAHTAASMDVSSICFIDLAISLL